MTRVATCPHCAAQLAVPESAAAEAQATCPFCESRFALNGAVRTLRSLMLIDADEREPEEETPLSSEVTLRGGPTDMPTLSTLSEKFRDASQIDEYEDEYSSDLDDTVVNGEGLTQDPFDFDTSELGIERQPDIDYQPNALERMEPAISTSQHDPAERAFVADVVSVAQAQKRRTRGSRSLVRQMVGVVGGGVIGLTLGYFALLWWRGPEGDLLGIADRIPTMLLPDTFDRADDTALASRASDPQKPDNEVEQAAFVGTAPAETTHEPPEPPPTEPQDAKPLVAEAAVRDAPNYTVDQLDAAIGPAEAAREGLLTGSLANPKEKLAKGKSYAILCQAAETLTFVPANTLPALSRHTTRQLFESTLQEAKARDEIGQIALRWIDYPSRPHGGIFFAGKVLSSKQVGSVHELQLQLPGGQSLTVLTPRDPDSRSNLVGVVGSVVEKPAERISGYDGTVDRAVWSRMLLPIE